MRKATILLLLLNTFFSFSQETNLSSILIPKELKKNANAVVRYNSTEVIIEDINKMIVRKKRIITILNKVGDKEVDTYAHYDNDTKINKLSAKIYDAFGNEIKKYSKRKFLDVSAVDGGTLYSDSRVKYIDYTPTSYPYTVVFESEYKTSSTGFIPKWYPLESYYLSVENSEYKIINSKHFNIRIKEKNFDNFSIEKINGPIIHYKMVNQPAIKYENNSIPFVDLMPSLLSAMNSFSLKGVSGEAHDWKTFGTWMNNKLLNDKNQLSEQTINHVKSLIANTNNNVEKARIIYNYVQNKTRYISVQVGIGGWEPIAADEVDKVSYGDCKGLTNYTKALFDAVGLEANYTVVYAQNRRDIDSDFASIQGNHVILNIPNNGNDIWLECTSQTLPFGFLGDFTDDRNVLVVTKEGGIIKRTPAYKNETNLQVSKAIITLDSLGNANARLERTSGGIQYDNIYQIENKSKEDQKKFYTSKTWGYNNNLEIKNITLKNNKEEVIFTENLDILIGDYASLNQGDYLFRLNVFNKNTYVPQRYRTRTSPLKIDRGYKDVDEYTFKIPQGYSIGVLPDKKEIKTKFGNYSLSIYKKDDSTLIYKKSILIKDGVYPKEDYKFYRKFRKKIAKLENLRVALIKK